MGSFVLLTNPVEAVEAQQGARAFPSLNAMPPNPQDRIVSRARRDPHPPRKSPLGEANTSSTPSLPDLPTSGASRAAAHTCSTTWTVRGARVTGDTSARAERIRVRKYELRLPLQIHHHRCDKPGALHVVLSVIALQVTRVWARAVCCCSSPVRVALHSLARDSRQRLSTRRLPPQTNDSSRSTT